MKGRARLTGLALLLAAPAACSAILGLEAPPAQDLATAPDAAGGDEAAASDAGAPPPPVCAPLSGGTTNGSYSALGEDAGAWVLFDVSRLTGFRNGNFAGGAFDGRYVYFAGRSAFVGRYDTQGAFAQATSWSEFALSALGVPGGFAGAVFDGRYVYFVPYAVGTTNDSVIARYDSTLPFGVGTSWATFDLATLAADGGASTIGFAGATFDGRYVYFVPHDNGVPDGRVVRYDTRNDAGPVPTAGDAGDAGEGGGATFGGPGLWATIDLSSINPLATGFVGGVFDGKALHLVPNVNDAFDAAVHVGGSGLVAKYRVDAGFSVASSWSTFDMTTINSLAEADWGGAFDGRYVYFVPRSQGIVTRLDTGAGQSSTSLASWESYDLARVVAFGGAADGYAGAAFDGRFVYLVPTGNGFGTVVRYDTASTFTADCAWSTLDLTRLAGGEAGAQNFFGAVFDGRYLYFVPFVGGVVARFDARTPSLEPSLPAFHGSFF